MYVQLVEYVVLEREQAEQDCVRLEREHGDDEPGRGVEQVVVRGRDDREQDQRGVAHEEVVQAHAAPARARARGRVREQRPADDERVPEVEARHRGVLVAELVGRPHGGDRAAVDGVDEAVALWEEARGHARPEGEYDESEEVGERERAPRGSVRIEALGAVKVG